MAERRRRANVAGRPQVAAFDGKRSSGPLARGRSAGLDGDELADRCFARAGLEAHHESDLEGVRQPLQGCEAGPVLARLDA